MQKYLKRKIMIDLEDVLCEIDDNFDENVIPGLKRGAGEFLQNLLKAFPDGELYLFTTKNVLLVSKWLIENKIDCYFEEVINKEINAYLKINNATIYFYKDYQKLFEVVENYAHYKSKKS